MRSQALRFSPSAYQLMALDAAAGAAAYAVTMWLRFIDEGVPATYAQRLLPWLVVGALVQVGVGNLMSRLRRPGSPLARRPVLPFVVAALLGYLPLVVLNEFLGEPWHLPRSMILIAPLLAATASAALRLAAERAIEPEELLSRPVVQLNIAACAPALRGKRVLITG
ncbi:MAG TPA: hypothetical protein VFG86_09930, partial [Chloroflexota bacterium]|nr:hypothetical protein [Chloroflexota bacterium]